MFFNVPRKIFTQKVSFKLENLSNLSGFSYFLPWDNYHHLNICLNKNIKKGSSCLSVIRNDFIFFKNKLVSDLSILNYLNIKKKYLLILLQKKFQNYFFKNNFEIFYLKKIKIMLLRLTKLINNFILNIRINKNYLLCIKKLVKNLRSNRKKKNTNFF